MKFDLIDSPLFPLIYFVRVIIAFIVFPNIRNKDPYDLAIFPQIEATKKERKIQGIYKGIQNNLNHFKEHKFIQSFEDIAIN